MKERKGHKPEIRVLDEESEGAEVVRLGGQEQILRLGESGAQPIKGKPKPQRLHVAPSEGVEARDASVEEILDTDAVVGSPEDPLEESWGGEAKRWLGVPWGWFAVIGLVCVGLALWSLRHIFQHRDANDEIAQRAEEIVSEERRKNEEARALYQRLEDRVANYLASGSTEELVKHVRDPERVAPLIAGHYAEQPPVPEEFLSMEEITPVTIGRRPFWVMRARTSVGMRVLLVEQTDDDDGLVDWEIDVCHQPIPWEEYVSGRPAGRFDFRLKVRADNYYVHEFADQSVYRSLRLGAPGSKEHLYGYVLRGSDAERTIMEVLGPRVRTMPMILRIEFPEDGVGKQSVLVTEVICADWCLIDETT